MADFFVREVRECLSGDMVVVRSMPFPSFFSCCTLPLQRKKKQKCPDGLLFVMTPCLAKAWLLRRPHRCPGRNGRRAEGEHRRES